MRYALKAEEMKACDKDTIERIGLPSMVLMERAAMSVLNTLEGLELCPRRVLVVAGTGNNGGDGLAVGRLLAQRGVEVTFYIEGNPERMTKETRLQRKILENSGFSIQSKFEIMEYDMVIDALFGIGLSGEIAGSCRTAVEQINLLGKRGAVVCSLDIPSGVCADDGRVLGCGVRADITVAFAFAKRGHLLYPGREFTGRLFVKDIGITEKSFLGKSPSAFYYEREDLSALLPERKKAGNKGSFGKVLLIAGSRDMCGACILCGKGIIRTGAGMLKIITPACNRQILQQSLPEAMLYTFEEMPEEEKLRGSMDWADVIVAGPGLGTGEVSGLLMEKVLEYKRHLPVVIDADGLNLIAAESKRKEMAENAFSEGELVLTPHPGELMRLLKKGMEEYPGHQERLARELAEMFSCVVAAKDAASLVAGAGQELIYINTSGNNGMATAGSGDVLAGVIGGLLAQGMRSFEAASLGVFLHGLAGDEAAGTKGEFGMLAGDIAEAVGLVTKQRMPRSARHPYVKQRAACSANCPYVKQRAVRCANCPYVKQQAEHSASGPYVQ